MTDLNGSRGASKSRGYVRGILTRLVEARQKQADRMVAERLKGGFFFDDII
ncbi:hypothetical protein [Consotaella salsifontis]|uniref:Uncharacterized protein n=1 Tax=Consotaella salsifontis TaxID=1365950 RepID=A0A1T4T1P8_9HYPH|nr:hypothetical protein [Consotaella salsifontis]SKA34317.1 hypothetical protein SAMN05428963_11715 [Consotaella salsifontis]